MSGSYKIEKRGNCVVAYGALPLPDGFNEMLELAPEGAVVDLHVARLLGATLVAGTAEDLLVLARDKDILDAARERSRGLLESVEGAFLPEGAVEWHATGERGASSNAIFENLTGTGNEASVPSDAYDFRRCRLLTEQVPALLELLPRMKTVSPRWNAFIERWDDLCQAMDKENPGWRQGKGPYVETMAIIREIEEACRQN